MAQMPAETGEEPADYQQLQQPYELVGGFNDDLLTLANQRATQFKKDRLALQERIDELKSVGDETDTVVNLARSWKTADYKRKKNVAMIMIHKIVISEDGSTKVLWNI